MPGTALWIVITESRRFGKHRATSLVCWHSCNSIRANRSKTAPSASQADGRCTDRDGAAFSGQDTRLTVNLPQQRLHSTGWHGAAVIPRRGPSALPYSEAKFLVHRRGERGRIALTGWITPYDGDRKACDCICQLMRIGVEVYDQNGRKFKILSQRTSLRISWNVLGLPTDTTRGKFNANSETSGASGLAWHSNPYPISIIGGTSFFSGRGRQICRGACRFRFSSGNERWRQCLLSGRQLLYGSPGRDHCKWAGTNVF